MPEPASEPAPEPIPEPNTFEGLMSELEALTDRLASGELGIEAAAELYERAERLHAAAAERLSAVQARVERLSQASDG